MVVVRARQAVGRLGTTRFSHHGAQALKQLQRAVDRRQITPLPNAVKNRGSGLGFGLALEVLQYPATRGRESKAGGSQRGEERHTNTVTLSQLQTICKYRYPPIPYAIKNDYRLVVIF